MGILKALASAGLKATEKVVEGTAKITGKAVAGTAKVAGKAVVGTAKVTGKAVVGTAKFVGKDIADSANESVTRYVGREVIKKTGIIESTDTLYPGFEYFVGNTTIKAVTGGLKFANNHKKEVLIAGVSLKAADSISHMIYKRDEEKLGNENDFEEEENYKMSIYDFLSTSKKRVLFRMS